MLIACSRCGKIHGYGECSLGEIKKIDKRVKERTDIVKFRSSLEWQHKREQIIQRDNYVCRLCLHNHMINNRKLEVHHIIKIQKNDTLKLDDNNLITLCHTCHKLVENDKMYIGLLLNLARTPARLETLQGQKS